MKKIKNTLISSLLELKSTQNIVLCGLLGALSIVLGMVASISIGPYIRIGFSGLPNRLVDFLFGPVVGCFFGGTLDVLKYFMKPEGSFFFGFTFNAMLSGIIYGSILYKKPLSIKRVICAELLVKVVVNCLLGTLWLSMLYGKAFSIMLPVRALKNAIMLPIDSAILFFALTYAKKLMAHLGSLTTRKIIS